jgi:uncharacterized membrane protein YvlD (DUF360 family)
MVFLQSCLSFINFLTQNLVNSLFFIIKICTKGVFNAIIVNYDFHLQKIIFSFGKKWFTFIIDITTFVQEVVLATVHWLFKSTKVKSAK